MGFLMDIRSGRRVGLFGYALVAWIIIGAGLGAVIGTMLWQSEQILAVLVLVGGLAGGAIGVYAEWGTSAAANVLALPGLLLRLIK